MATATPGPTIYDQENLRLMQTGLAPWLNRMAEDRALANRNAWLDRQNQFLLQRDQAERDAAAEELQQRDQAMEGTVEEMLKLEDQLAAVVKAEDHRRMRSAMREAERAVLLTFPELAEKRDKVPNLTFETALLMLADRDKDLAPAVEEALQKYKETAVTLASKKGFDPNPAAEAQINALTSRVSLLNRALLAHVQRGGSLPRIPPLELRPFNDPDAQFIEDLEKTLPLPDNILQETPPELTKPGEKRVTGAIPEALSGARQTAAEITREIELVTRPVRQRVKNAASHLFGGTVKDPKKVYSDDESAELFGRALGILRRKPATPGAINQAVSAASGGFGGMPVAQPRALVPAELRPPAMAAPRPSGPPPELAFPTMFGRGGVGYIPPTAAPPPQPIGPPIPWELQPRMPQPNPDWKQRALGRLLQMLPGE